MCYNILSIEFNYFELALNLSPPPLTARKINLGGGGWSGGPLAICPPTYSPNLLPQLLSFVAPSSASPYCLNLLFLRTWK